VKCASSSGDSPLTCASNACTLMRPIYNGRRGWRTEDPASIGARCISVSCRSEVTRECSWRLTPLPGAPAVGTQAHARGVADGSRGSSESASEPPGGGDRRASASRRDARGTNARASGTRSGVPPTRLTRPEVAADGDLRLPSGTPPALAAGFHPGESRHHLWVRQAATTANVLEASGDGALRQAGLKRRAADRR